MAGRHRRPLPLPEELLGGYLEFLRRHRGISASWMQHQRTALRDFLAYLAGSGLSPAEVRPEDLDGFLMSVSAVARSKRYLCGRAQAVRGFLRYLFAEEWLERDLSEFVETPRIYREATIPPHFTWSELEHMLASVTGREQEALRDRALLCLLSAYGLRGGEVARLTLDDLDWTHEKLRMSGRKSGPDLVLPLLPAVRTPLIEYIRFGRPADTPYREIFLTGRGRPPRGGYWVTGRLHLLAARAGLPGSRGSHAARRAVGTRLVEQGWGLGAVGVILGHGNPRSTRVYLRLSMESLRDVADNYGEVL